MCFNKTFAVVVLLLLPRIGALMCMDVPQRDPRECAQFQESNTQPDAETGLFDLSQPLDYLKNKLLTILVPLPTVNKIIEAVNEWFSLPVAKKMILLGVVIEIIETEQLTIDTTTQYWLNDIAQQVNLIDEIGAAYSQLISEIVCIIKTSTGNIDSKKVDAIMRHWLDSELLWDEIEDQVKIQLMGSQPNEMIFDLTTQLGNLKDKLVSTNKYSDEFIAEIIEHIPLWFNHPNVAALFVDDAVTIEQEEKIIVTLNAANPAFMGLIEIIRDHCTDLEWSAGEINAFVSIISEWLLSSNVMQSFERQTIKYFMNDEDETQEGEQPSGESASLGTSIPQNVPATLINPDLAERSPDLAHCFAGAALVGAQDEATRNPAVRLILSLLS